VTVATGPLPKGAQFDAGALLFSWTPSLAQSGTWPVLFTATDGKEFVAHLVQIAVVPPLFVDTFTHGTAAGDREWNERTGDWSVTRGKVFTCSPAKRCLATARPAASRVATGRIEALVKLSTPTATVPNARIVFALRKAGHAYRYRFVQLTPSGLRIGDTQGAGASWKMELELDRWYRVGVDLHRDGLVLVTLDGVPVASHQFGTAIAGETGYAVTRAQSYFDDFFIWDASILEP
jgi:hypothetical protein